MMLIIIAVVLIVMFVITMFIHLEHKLKAVKAIVLILIVLLIGSSLYTWVKSDTNDLSSPKGVANSIYMYAGWMGDIGMKLFSTLGDSFNSVGNVIRGNETRQNQFDGRN
jgi:hypothetical protein